MYSCLYFFIYICTLACTFSFIYVLFLVLFINLNILFSIVACSLICTFSWTFWQTRTVRRTSTYLYFLWTPFETPLGGVDKNCVRTSFRLPLFHAPWTSSPFYKKTWNTVKDGLSLKIKNLLAQLYFIATKYLWINARVEYIDDLKSILYP